MKRLRVRIGSSEMTESELERIQSFYEKHRHEGNAIRDPDILRRAIRDNKSYIIEDIDNEEIVGLSFCFVLGDGLYTESGGTRIVLGGYRLQRVINYVAAMHEFLLDPPEYEYYSIVADWNAPSFGNLLAIGFERWAPDAELVRLINVMPREGKSFYRLPREALPQIRDNLLDIVENPLLPGKAELEPVSIEFDIVIIKAKVLTRQTKF